MCLGVEGLKHRFLPTCGFTMTQSSQAFGLGCSRAGHWRGEFLIKKNHWIGRDLHGKPGFFLPSNIYDIYIYDIYIYIYIYM